MNELFNKIFESDVLTDDTKNELKEAFNTVVAEAAAEAKANAEIQVKAELAEQFVTDKEALIEALETKSELFMTRELEELKEDIARYRNLEVEYAEKLVEARKDMANTVKSDMAELIESLDKFFEFRLNEEFEELRSDIAEAKELAFGRRVFESFVSEFKKNFQNEDDTYLALEEAQGTLVTTTSALKEAQKELKAIKHAQELNRVLEPLAGKSREVMEAILKQIPTDKLEETYGKFIGRVLHENAGEVVEAKSEKESDNTSVLAENDTSTVNDNEKPKLKVVTGDSLNENANNEKAPGLDEAALAQLKRLAGIN